MSDKTTIRERTESLAATLEERYQGRGCEVSLSLNEVTMVVPREQLIELAAELRDDEAFHFEIVVDICGVDYSTYGESEWVTTEASSSGFGRGVEQNQNIDTDKADRFAVVYHLLSSATISVCVYGCLSITASR